MKVFVAGATGAMGRQRFHAGGGGPRRRRHDPERVQAGGSGRARGNTGGGRRTRRRAGCDRGGQGTPGRDRPPADRDRHARPASLRPRLRADQPAADPGHRPPVVGRPRRRGRRFIAQSYTSWPYARTGGQVKSEDDPLDPTPAREMRESLAAIRHLESAVTGADWTEGIVPRYGAFYGPGTSMSTGGEQFEMIRKRKFPWSGTGRGCGPSSTSRTPPTPPSRRSSVAIAGSSTSLSTTIRRRSPSGCRPSPRRSALRSLGGCRGSLAGCSPARPAR